MREKKVLLMGDAASGKSSMRAVIFKNTIPDLTSRLSTTHSYEMENYKFFGSRSLSLVDCGGQHGFMESYLTDDGEKILFAHVSALIYVFEVTKLDSAGRPPELSLQYFSRCLKALGKRSPQAPVFVLIQKMDLIQPEKRQSEFDMWIKALKQICGQEDAFIAFGTSIYEDTLYRAWSAVVRILVPNLSDLTRNLGLLSQSCGALETAMFEKTTFLLIARSSVEEPVNHSLVSTHLLPDIYNKPVEDAGDATVALGQANRFEMISKLIKAFKHDARRFSSEPFDSLRMEMSDFTLVLTSLTPTSYVLVIASAKEPRITPDAIVLNISHARPHFEALQAAAK